MGDVDFQILNHFSLQNENLKCGTLKNLYNTVMICIIEITVTKYGKEGILGRLIN